MHGQQLTIKKSRSSRVCLCVFTAILFISTLLFIPTFTTDRDSMIFVIISGPLTILLALITVSQCCYKIQFNGKDILYKNGLLIKNELHTSQISKVSVNDSKGMTVYEREQKKLFFVPVRSKKFLSLLVYLKQQGVTLRFNRLDSRLEQTVNQFLSGTEIYDELPEKNYYVEKPSPKSEKIHILNMVVPFILPTIAFSLCIFAVDTNDNFLRILLISGFFILAVLQMLLLTAAIKRMRRNIQNGAVSLPARIIHFERQNATTATPSYEFKDKNGLHGLPALDSIKLKRSAEEQWVGEPRQILYNAQFPTAVIDTDPPIAKTNSVVSRYISSSILMFIGIVLFASSMWIEDSRGSLFALSVLIESRMGRMSIENSDTAKALKTDAEGYYTLKYYNEGRTLVKAPEGFELSEFASDTYLMFYRKIAKIGSAQISVDVDPISSDSEEDLKTTAKRDAGIYLENKENIDFHDIQETEINGIKVTYIYYDYEYPDSNGKTKKCQIWWTVDDEYMIVAEISESTVALDDSFIFDDSTMVQTIFDCVKNKD